MKSLFLAFQNFKRAADLKSPQGELGLADCYMLGFGVKIDSKEAARLYKSAADKGEVLGYVGLGKVYSIKTNIIFDPKK